MGYGYVDSKTPFEASPKYPILKSRIGLKNVLKMENTFLFTAYFLESADTFLIIILQISLGIKKSLGHSCTGYAHITIIKM